jgi:hypothetical protein
LAKNNSQTITPINKKNRTFPITVSSALSKTTLKPHCAVLGAACRAKPDTYLTVALREYEKTRLKTGAFEYFFRKTSAVIGLCDFIADVNCSCPVQAASRVFL